MGNQEIISPNAVCSDGTIVELAIDPETGDLDYLVFDSEKNEVTREGFVQDGSVRYEPPSEGKDLCTTGVGTSSGLVLLPTEAVSYGSEEELVSEA